MNSDYVAWNGERYVWPPPEGWYLASDGRWWAPDTGPAIDLDPSPADTAFENGTDHTVDATPPADPIEVAEPAPKPEPGPISTPAGYDPGPAPQHSLGTESTPGLQPPQTEEARPASSSPASGQVAAVPDFDATTAMPAEAADGRLNPTMVMADPSRPGTGPNPVVSADPDTGRHDQVQILETADETPSANVQRSRTMPMVAAGLLAAAAIVIAALLSLLGGDDETQTQQPSASAEDTTVDPEDGADELVVSTEDAMDDGAMEDGAMEEDGEVMGEDGQQSSTTTAVDPAGDAESAALIGQFRTLLEDNQITAAGLTGDDLVVFGDTACSYATSAADLPEYEQIRDEALNGAQNDELSIDELQFVIDAAVTVFCAGDATRLGLTATAPADG